MKNSCLLLIIIVFLSSCKGSDSKPGSDNKQSPGPVSPNAVLIASDIVTDIIVKPDPHGDPWEIEKVAGYRGEYMVNSIFDHIYDGSLTVYNYHTGEALSAKDVRAFEREYNNDRSVIGKLSFTEDWYYNPVTNTIEKITRSIVFGYELYNNDSTIYGYRAAFRADLGK